MSTYTDLAPWWPVMTPPEEYDELAALLLCVMQEGMEPALTSLLELGSATGHMATHVPQRIEVVLNDLQPQMLAVSQALNPEREHVLGDLCTLQLERTFDAVLLHDVVMYLDPKQLQAAVASAHRHLPVGGVVLLVPDATLETLQPGVAQGGGDAEDGRRVRFIEWHHEPDAQGRFRVDFSFLLRGADGAVEQVHDVHQMWAHPQARYERLLEQAGFELLPETDLARMHGGHLILARKR